MRGALLGLVVLMAAGCGGSDDRVPWPVPAPAAPAVARPDLFGTNAVVAPSAPDAVLRYADHARAFAELRLPEGTGPFPLAVIFHGGCWKAGIATPAYMAPLATHWQKLGIATLNVDYREVGDGGGWPASFADWEAASRLIDEVARNYPVDRSRVTLVGHSAGALPALWLAMAQDETGPVGAREPLAVRAAVVFDGPADVVLERAVFDGLCGFDAVEPFMGGAPEAVPARYVAVSPIEHVPNLQQLLFVHAVLPAAPEMAQAAIRAGGVELAVRVNPGASHFAIITPGAPAYEANEGAILQVLRGR